MGLNTAQGVDLRRGMNGIVPKGTMFIDSNSGNGSRLNPIHSHVNNKGLCSFAMGCHIRTPGQIPWKENKKKEQYLGLDRQQEVILIVVTIYVHDKDYALRHQGQFY